MHYAVFLENLEIGNVLLKNGANVNIKDGKGITPRDLDFWGKNSDIIKSFLSEN